MEVVFAYQADALKAIERFNNMLLDGKPMKIELVGVNIVTHATMVPTTNGILGHYPSAGFGRHGFASILDVKQYKMQNWEYLYVCLVFVPKKAFTCLPTYVKILYNRGVTIQAWIKHFCSTVFFVLPMYYRS